MPLKGHLNYGGSIGPKGTLAYKTAKGSTFQTTRRLESIIRLENAGFTHSAIAAMLVISPTRLAAIKKTPTYIQARIKLTHGIILDNESQVQLIKDQRKEILTQMLPPALQVLADEIQRPAQTLAERKHKSAIALELLDREGTFAKVSRTEVKPVENFDFEKADAESMSIIAALKGASAQPTHHTKDVVAANEKFSNSHTLSAVDQQAALDSLEEEAAVLSEYEALESSKGLVN